MAERKKFMLIEGFTNKLAETSENFPSLSWPPFRHASLKTPLQKRRFIRN
jgi:hypothetical protein